MAGYDAVAYQTRGEAVQGRNEHAFFWNGATWLFSSKAYRDAFAANPERCVPRYDGYSYAAFKATRRPAAPRPARRGRQALRELQPARSWSCGSHISAGDRNWPILDAN